MTNSEKIVIITGAGSGIGRAMALAFAATGAKILIADMQEKTAAETLALVQAAGGTGKIAVVDVGDEASVAAMVAAAITEWGRIDVLCNNAGIMDRMERIGDVATAQWDRVIRVNLTGVMFGTRAVLPHMLAQGGGVIVNTASEAGFRGGGAGGAYVASKHGVVGLTRATAWAYEKLGIRCNAICPGPVNTNISNGLGLAAFDPEGVEVNLPILNLMPRIAEPENMANVAVFLASDAAAFVNGAILPVDGGLSAG